MASRLPGAKPFPEPMLLLIGPLGTEFSEIRIEMKKNVIHKNAFEIIVCEMAAILSRGRGELSHYITPRKQ